MWCTHRTGTPDSLEQLLSAAVAKCPGAEILWLVWAKEKWSRGDVAGAREVLVNAFKVIAWWEAWKAFACLLACLLACLFCFFFL